MNFRDSEFEDSLIPKLISDENFSVDKLEANKLPPEVDAALREYFAHAPFDERIDSLLDGAEVSDTSLTFEASTDIEIHPQHFKHNVFTELGSSTAFAIAVREMHDSDIDTYSFTLTSTTSDDRTIHFDRDPAGHFNVMNEKTGEISKMSAYEVALMTLRATNVDDSPLQELSEVLGEASNEFHGILKKRWEVACERNQGIVEKSHCVSVQADESSIETPVEIRLGIKEIEDSGSSILLTLEKAVIYEALEAEKVYRLEILYTQHRSSSDAKQIIRGDGGITVRSIRAIHSNLQGSEKPLNLTDEEVLALFVDAYEEILAKVA